MADTKSSKKPVAVSAEKITKSASTKIDYLHMTEGDLNKAIVTLREDIVTLKRGNVTGDVQNVHAYGARRKELARALTARNTVREVK